jgi:hypothetical protein
LAGALWCSAADLLAEIAQQNSRCVKNRQKRCKVLHKCDKLGAEVADYAFKNPLFALAQNGESRHKWACLTGILSQNFKPGPVPGFFLPGTNPMVRRAFFCPAQIPWCAGLFSARHKSCGAPGYIAPRKVRVVPLAFAIRPTAP